MLALSKNFFFCFARWDFQRVEFSQGDGRNFSYSAVLLVAFRFLKKLICGISSVSTIFLISISAAYSLSGRSSCKLLTNFLSNNAPSIILEKLEFGR